MAVGFVGYVMKNNVKVNQFSCTVYTLEDGSQRVSYDGYDFVGLRGWKRRKWKWTLGIKKKRFPITRIFRYNDEWDTLTDGGCISYWDQTTQAQIPLYALRNENAYRKVTEEQQKANDVLYYCLQADDLVDHIAFYKEETTIWDLALPALLIGGIIMTAVMNVYAVSQYLQAWGIIHGTSGSLQTLQNWFQNFGGVGGLALMLPRKQKKPQSYRPVQIDTVDVLLKEKGLVMGQYQSMPVYEERFTGQDSKAYQRNVILMKEGKKTYKVPVILSDDYMLRGTKSGTIYVFHQPNSQVSFKQLSLDEMGMSATGGKEPIEEDMGKVLVKVLQDNLNLKKAPPTLVAGLTKTLFYTFIFSIIIYALMFAVNLYLLNSAVSAFQSVQGAINILISHFTAPVP